MFEENALAEALKRNNFDEAKKLMAQGDKLPNKLESYEKRQIYDAVIRGKAFEFVDMFVKDGLIETDIYEYDKLDGSFFESLFRNLGDSEDDLDFLTTFLQRVDNINDAVEDQTLLWLAFNSSAKLEVIKALVDTGCDVNYKNNYEENFLYKIAQEFGIREDIGVQYFEYLIGEGVDPNAGNIVKNTPLQIAIGKNKKQYVEILLQNGADPNQPGIGGDTVFYTALVHQCSDIEIYNKLKEYAPADFDIRNKADETLLLGVVRMRHGSNPAEIELLQAFIADGADIYQAAPYYGQDKTALDWICERSAEVLEGVMETGAVDLERKDNKGNTLLHKVCAINVNYDQEAAKQIYKKVKLLIEQGAEVNSTNDMDQTPMLLAAQDNLKSKTVELLLKNKAQ